MNYRSSMISGTARVGGRTLFRTALGYQINKHWKVTARGENLTNKEYEDTFQFGTAGISGFAGLEYKF